MIRVSVRQERFPDLAPQILSPLLGYDISGNYRSGTRYNNASILSIDPYLFCALGRVRVAV